MSKPPHTDNRAVVFLRVSSHRQKGNSSHDTQEKESLEYCGRRGFEVAKVFRIVESASDPEKRREYSEAMLWAEKRKICHRVFYVYDRETRNLTDNERNEKRVRSSEIVLHYVRENKVIDENSPDSDFFMRDINAVTNKQFIRQLRSKVKDAMLLKAEEGWFPNNHAPLGYVHQKRRDDDGRERKRGTIIVPDPIERNVRQVQREFELRAKRLPLQSIRDQIVAEGLIAPQKIKTYYVSAVDRRLRNKFYRGFFDWQGVEYRGKHDLVIPPNILQAVDESFGVKARYTAKQQHAIFGGGWFKCADENCGCHILSDPKTKKIKATGKTKTYFYYHCSNGRRVHEKQVNVEESKIWNQLDGAVDQITITEDLAEKISEALNETHRKVETAVRREISGYSKALDALDLKKDRLVDMRIAGELGELEYKKQSQRLTDERHEITAMLEKAQLSISGAYLKTAKSILELASKAKTLWIQRSPEERKMLLEKILSNPVLDGPSVRYELKKPFAVLAEMAGKVEWRPLRDSNSCLLRERELS